MREVRAFFGVRPVPDVRLVYGLFDGDTCYGVCGVAREPVYQGTVFEPDARHIGFLDLKEVPDNWRMRLVLAMRSVLRNEIDFPVYVQRDDNYQTSEKLLKSLGFECLEEGKRDRRTGNQLEIWRWQP